MFSEFICWVALTIVNMGVGWVRTAGWVIPQVQTLTTAQLVCMPVSQVTHFDLNGFCLACCSQQLNPTDLTREVAYLVFVAQSD